VVSLFSLVVSVAVVVLVVAVQWREMFSDLKILKWESKPLQLRPRNVTFPFE
jgi:hypothetical protein